MMMEQGKGGAKDIYAEAKRLEERRESSQVVWIDVLICCWSNGVLGRPVR